MNAARTNTAASDGAMPTTSVIVADPLDLIWGVAGIGAFIGKSAKATYYMCEAGELPGVKQVGRRWVASRRKLKEHFEGLSA